MMAADFFDVAAKVKEEGMHLAIATNGTLISRDVARKLKALGTDYLEMSLDSADAGEVPARKVYILCICTIITDSK